MILISYPSGGFGNFLYHCLTEFANNTYKPDNKDFKFDLLGRSHDTEKYSPVYFHDPDNYEVLLPDTDLECLILCDNGINNDSYTNINKVFRDATIIRTVIDESVRPIIYKTCVVKAQNSNTIKETKQQVDSNWIDSNEDYAKRENFTLLYHNWPFKWDKDPSCINMHIEHLITNPVDTINSLIVKLGGNTIKFDQLVAICSEWSLTNFRYFKIYHDWKKIESALDNKQSVDITDITDLHDQGYINYCIECKFNVTIPVYDYQHWFSDTGQIQKMLDTVQNSK